MTSPLLDHATRNGRAPDVFRLFSPVDLAGLPPMTYLVDGVIPARGSSVLFGPSGIGKSFVTLDLALCIATGEPWHAHAVQAGLVVYFAAEGVAGIPKRIAAWSEHRGVEPERIRFLADAVNMLDAESVSKARRTLDSLDEPPALIVIDTMARSLVGGDENSARDVGQFIANVDALREPYDAATLVVHHTGKDGDAERGSSALRGAADVMCALRPDGGGVKLESVKTKDSEPFESLRFVLTPTLESCVLVVGSNQGALGSHERVILETLTDSFGSDEAATGKLRQASGVPDRTFYRAIKSLEKRELIERRVDGRAAYYRLSITARDCQAETTITAVTPPPLKGGSGSHGDTQQLTGPPPEAGAS